MVSQELPGIYRCPACVRNGPQAGLLTLVKGVWLVCQDCHRKYPIRDEIPVMLIEEGEKWVQTAESDLVVPPPA